MPAPPGAGIAALEALLLGWAPPFLEPGRRAASVPSHDPATDPLADRHHSFSISSLELVIADVRQQFFRTHFTWPLTLPDRFLAFLLFLVFFAHEHFLVFFLLVVLDFATGAAGAGTVT